MAAKKNNHKKHTGSLNEIKIRPKGRQKTLIKDVKEIMGTSVGSQAILGALSGFIQLRKDYEELESRFYELQRNHVHLVSSVEEFNEAQGSYNQAQQNLAKVLDTNGRTETEYVQEFPDQNKL